MNVFDWILSSRGRGDAGFKPRPATRPTFAQPGTRHKVNVMCDRAEAGVELFDPGDPTCFDTEKE